MVGFEQLSRNVPRGCVEENLLVNASFSCSGKIRAWKYGLVTPSVEHSLVFQVWRFISSGTVTLVGSNLVQVPRDDTTGIHRVLYQVPLDEQIHVEPGDFIGIYIPLCPSLAPLASRGFAQVPTSPFTEIYFYSIVNGVEPGLLQLSERDSVVRTAQVGLQAVLGTVYKCNRVACLIIVLLHSHYCTGEYTEGELECLVTLPTPDSPQNTDPTGATHSSRAFETPGSSSDKLLVPMPTLLLIDSVSTTTIINTDLTSSFTIPSYDIQITTTLTSATTVLVINHNNVISTPVSTNLNHAGQNEVLLTERTPHLIIVLITVCGVILIIVSVTAVILLIQLKFWKRKRYSQKKACEKFKQDVLEPTPKPNSKCFNSTLVRPKAVLVVFHCSNIIG